MNFIALFGIIHKSTILANFYLYLRYFQKKKNFNTSKINKSQADPNFKMLS